MAHFELVVASSSMQNGHYACCTMHLPHSFILLCFDKKSADLMLDYVAAHVHPRPYARQCGKPSPEAPDASKARQGCCCVSFRWNWKGCKQSINVDWHARHESCSRVQDCVLLTLQELTHNLQLSAFFAAWWSSLQP
jgi:hypothetical protein